MPLFKKHTNSKKCAAEQNNKKCACICEQKQAICKDVKMY